MVRVADRGRNSTWLLLSSPHGLLALLAMFPTTSPPQVAKNLDRTCLPRRDRTGAEAGQKKDETGLNAPLDIGAAIWVQPCHDYPAHRNAHRNTPAGWICPSCH